MEKTRNSEGVLGFHVSLKMKEGKTKEQAIKLKIDRSKKIKGYANAIFEHRR